MTERPADGACVHFHALFLDTQLDVVLPARLGRLLTGRTPDERVEEPVEERAEPVPEQQGAAR
ncbi:hypothetical protein [Streptomyces sp. B93]|uniref:hypothetical protein n=1 Tax=Streptomyces sp. B93 TaxID=2824875 RepID=UPI001B362A51|nr:hypothetical protein [Streptomyces sp. B93]MBQ1089972.1 hypothetical protein [Streptomyces sp. B93]